MPSKNFKLKTIIEKIITNWYLIFLAMLIGGLVGYGISVVLTPRYEAVAQVSTSIDYTISPEIEDYMEDRAINEAGWLMISDSVLENVQSMASDQGVLITTSEMQNSFYVERIDDLWTLRVIGSDPEIIAMLANLWVDEAYSQLDAAFEHAQAAIVLTTYINSLEKCLDSLPAENDGFAICTIDNEDSLAKEIVEKTEQLNIELELSRSLFPASRYALVSYAQVPTTPVFHTRGILVLSGALLGLVLILAFFFFKAGRE